METALWIAHRFGEYTLIYVCFAFVYSLLVCIGVLISEGLGGLWRLICRFMCRIFNCKGD